MEHQPGLKLKLFQEEDALQINKKVGGLSRDFTNGFMSAEKSDMQSASSFVGYAGLPITKNEALLKCTAKTLPVGPIRLLL